MPEPSEELKILVCAAAPGSHTEDSIMAEAGCGHLVYVAGAGQREMAADPTISLRCIGCALPHIKPGGRIEAAAGALDDLDREFGEAARAQAEQILNAMKRSPS